MAHFHIDHAALTGNQNEPTHAAKPQEEFHNVFDYPDFIEMRPPLRKAVHTVAEESFDQPVLPVQIERMAVALEEQLERETRKYEAQKAVFNNQKTELNDLVRLYTQVLQVISRNPDPNNTDVEDLIFAVDQTRQGLRNLPTKDGEGPLYNPDSVREIEPATFYDFVIQRLAHPYFINDSHALKRQNLSSEGQKFVERLSAYAFRDWDAYLTHEYDAQHIIKNEKKLDDKVYYTKLEETELKYADKAYAQVFADTFNDFAELLTPAYLKDFEIHTTPIPVANAVLRRRLTAIIYKYFLVDDQGYEHVMDEPIKQIKTKYAFYLDNFSD
ncbi:hypothetical protein [Loigolactobacillus jiayinensis]|uniref:Uncharacterized protein n=1 Tax=Loigolactobacillus jiayinensis TaxID=2486016 RepID=A0ABW1RDH9_9LACO|nr:hypothetical protein [Loigolactobacillus jiayinensis]